MNRTMWRQLASGLLAATLSLGIAACDDDTSSGTGDMSMMAGADMSATADDMSMGKPGNAQVTLADIVGTAYQGTMAVPRVHTLTALASFTKFVGNTADPSSDFALGPPPHGCSIYRYDIGAGKVPGSDADAGPVSMTGYNLNTIGTDVNTGINAPPASDITCVRGGPLMTYSCFYGTMPNLTDAGSAGMGALTGDIIYAPLPTLNPATCPGSVLAGGATGPFFCEQYPILRNFNSVISESVAGGADYVKPTPATQKFGSLDPDSGAPFPDQLTIISVKSGTTEIAGLDPVSGTIPAGTAPCPATSINGCQHNLDIADGMVDPAQPLAIQWSCDGTQTVGAGCTGSDFVGLLITTSTNAKGTFSSPQSTKFGVGQCVETVAKTTHTATVSAAQMTALVGGQTGGSIQIALVRLVPGISTSGPHIVVYTAGHGQFGFTNLP